VRVGSVEDGVPEGRRDHRLVLCKVCLADAKEVELVALWQGRVKVVVFRDDGNVVDRQASPHDVEYCTNKGPASGVALEGCQGF